MNADTFRISLLCTMAAALTSCGGGGTGQVPAPPSGTQNGTVSLVISDASSEDWATIGVKVLGVALVPLGGGSNVTVFTAPASAPMLNLAELDQLCLLYTSDAADE